MNTNDRAKPTAQLILLNYAGEDCDVIISRVDGHPRRGYDKVSVEFRIQPNCGPPWIGLSEFRRLLRRMEEMEKAPYP